LAYAPPEDAAALEREHQLGEYTTPRQGTARRKYGGMRQAQQDQLFDSKVQFMYMYVCIYNGGEPEHQLSEYTTPRQGTARRKYGGMRQVQQDQLFDTKVIIE